MKVTAVDLFCGAGGTSTGLLLACQELELSLSLVAVNHWEIAIATHSRNHPEAQHLCSRLEDLNPEETVGRGVDLLVASPECTHHSNARGGKPRSDQKRAQPWLIMDWIEKVRPKRLLIENVPEFQTWGPLDDRGRPLKSKRGAYFYAWIQAIKAANYRVEWRVLNAANYGDPTTRRRLFIQGRRGNRRIHWPEPTHTNKPGGLFKQKPWVPAREVIDWDLKGESIFSRKKALAPATLRRIEAGLKRYGGEAAEPFLVILRGTSESRSLDKPLPTVTAGGGHFGLVDPFVVWMKGDRDSRSVDAPLPTITTKPGLALCEPFLVPNFGERKGQTPRTHSIDDPLPAVTSHGAGALVEPFLVKYYGSGDACQGISEPLHTITANDRFGLAEPGTDGYRLDIRFRMLQPHELAKAMSFPKDYRFAGNKSETVKQIGNAVPVRLAQALFKELLAV